MSYIHKDNTKLKELGIDDQIGTYDLVLTHHLPAEEDLELYDIVLYEKDDGMLVIHRIVEIEEPNANHPNCRYFVLQGDANKYPDRIPVYYTQMRGIYRGERIPFVGSFVMFMQSPAGWMCIILVIVASVAAPIMGRRLENKKQARLAALGLLPPTPEEEGDKTA
jgi:signal peptidase I